MQAIFIDIRDAQINLTVIRAEGPMSKNVLFFFTTLPPFSVYQSLNLHSVLFRVY